MPSADIHKMQVHYASLMNDYGAAVNKKATTPEGKLDRDTETFEVVEALLVQATAIQKARQKDYNGAGVRKDEQHKSEIARWKKLVGEWEDKRDELHERLEEGMYIEGSDVETEDEEDDYAEEDDVEEDDDEVVRKVTDEDD